MQTHRSPLCTAHQYEASSLLYLFYQHCARFVTAHCVALVCHWCVYLTHVGPRHRRAICVHTYRLQCRAFFLSPSNPRVHWDIHFCACLCICKYGAQQLLHGAFIILQLAWLDCKEISPGGDFQAAVIWVLLTLSKVPLGSVTQGAGCLAPENMHKYVPSALFLRSSVLYRK